MILKLIRWLRGYVVFEIIGRFPERFINLSVRQGRFVFSVRPYPDRFLGTMLLRDYRNIRKVARKSAVRLRVKERHGLPFLLRRYRSRWGLAIGFVLFVIVILVMQSFIWTVEINGVTTISENKILQQLRANGIYSGSFKFGMDEQSVQRNLMLNIKEIGWSSVNILGTKAEIEIKEKDIKPHIIESDVPCNIKAESDGIIIEINTKYGTQVMSEGSAVIKGSLLVSGVNENPSGKVSFVHADAEVIAKTQYVEDFFVNRRVSCFQPVRWVDRHKVFVFGLEMPVSFRSVKENSTSRIKKDLIHLNNTAMPLGLLTEHCVEYESVDVNISEEAAVKKLTVDDYLYRLFALSDCEAVQGEVNYFPSDRDYRISVVYTCIEDIAVQEKFVVN